MNTATANPAARPVLDARAKAPTLAESAAAAKALKGTPQVPAIKGTAPLGIKPAKPQVSDKEKAAALKAAEKAKADKAKAKAKAAADKVKEAEKAAKAKEKAADDKAKADVKAAKAKERAAAKAEREANGGHDRLVPANLSQYHVDKEKKTAGGHASVDSNDTLAQKLRGKSIDEVYREAALVLKEDATALRAKYAHLNVGMQRMNLGNRMRAAVMKVEKPAAAKK